MSQLAAGNFHPTELKGIPPERRRDLRGPAIMLIVFALLVLWILSMYFYLPIPVVVLLFAAVATASTMAIWVALTNRQRAHSAVIERDTNR